MAWLKVAQGFSALTGPGGFLHRTLPAPCFPASSVLLLPHPLVHRPRCDRGESPLVKNPPPIPPGAAPEAQWEETLPSWRGDCSLTLGVGATDSVQALPPKYAGSQGLLLYLSLPAVRNGAPHLASTVCRAAVPVMLLKRRGKKQLQEVTWNDEVPKGV